MKNNTKFGINAIIITIVTVAAVILVNAIISTISSKLPMKIDLTKDRVYEFSQHTKEVMKKIDKDINVYALYPSNTNANEYITYAEEYLAKYSALNSKFKVTYIDPYTNPNFAKKYEKQGETINAGSVILECGDNVKVVTMDQMYQQNSYTNSVRIDMEKKITAAVISVTGQGKTAKAYFAQGHDEVQSSALKSQLEENGYSCSEVSTATAGIPSDCDLLIYMSPIKDLTAQERDALDGYLDGGGKAMFFFEPGTERPERIASYLAEWGITVRNDYVIEEDADYAFRLQNGMTIPAPKLMEHDITKNLISQKLVFMAPASSSIETNSNNVRNAVLTPLLQTTEKAYGKVNLASQTLEKEDGDNEGVQTLAVLSENQGGNYGKVMVLGSVQAIELSGILTESSYANGDFILNAAGYMTQSDTSLDIRAKEISASSLTMNKTQIVIVWLILQYLLPIIIIAAGLTMWLKRRYK